MRQATASALDDQLREGVARVRRADLLVGIPSFNNAGTVGHVARTVAAGLRTHFPDVKWVIVNADGGSTSVGGAVTSARNGRGRCTMSFTTSATAHASNRPTEIVSATQMPRRPPPRLRMSAPPMSHHTSPWKFAYVTITARTPSSWPRAAMIARYSR